MKSSSLMPGFFLTRIVAFTTLRKPVVFGYPASRTMIEERTFKEEVSEEDLGMRALRARGLQPCEAETRLHNLASRCHVRQQRQQRFFSAGTESHEPALHPNLAPCVQRGPASRRPSFLATPAAFMACIPKSSDSVRAIYWSYRIGN